MRRALSANNLNDFDPEPERTFRARRRQLRDIRVEEMAGLENAGLLGDNEQPRMTLGDYVMPDHRGQVSGVVRPPVQARNFELKPSLINMVQQNQFGGLPSENPHLHLGHFH